MGIEQSIASRIPRNLAENAVLKKIHMRRYEDIYEVTSLFCLIQGKNYCKESSKIMEI